MQKAQALSALRGVQASNYYPTLVLSCDIPLLNAELLERYCEKCLSIEADFVVGAIEFNNIAELFPNLKKTNYKFGSLSVCFASIFAVLSSEGVRAIQYWRGIEDSRKKPLEVIKRVGWVSALRYKTGLLDIERAAQQLSRKVGARVEIITVNIPELAIDVDSVADFEQLKDYMT